MLAAAIGALLLAAVAALAALAARSLTREMQEALGRQEQLRAQAMAERFDGLLSARRLALATLAETLPGPAVRTTAMLRQALAAQDSLSGAFLNIALFARNGDLVYSARPAVSRLYVAGTRPYFIEAVLQKQEMLSQPFTSALTGMPVVVMARPLLDAQGEVEYILAASLALAEAPMSAQVEGGGRQSYVMTTDGYLVSYPQRARLTHHVNEVPELQPDAALGLQGLRGWRVNEEASRVTAFARLRQAPWIVGLQAPEQLAFGPLFRARSRLLLAAAGLAVLGLAIAWPLSRLGARSPGLRPASVSTATLVAGGALPPAGATRPVQSLPPAQERIAASAPAGPLQPPALPNLPSRSADRAPAPPHAAASPELNLDAFMQANFTSDDQRHAFIATVAASVRKLPGEVSAAIDAMGTAPGRATGILHTLKGAWGSLGAREFAQSASALEAAIKGQQATGSQQAAFAQQAAQLQAGVDAWLASRESAAPAEVTPPAGELLPLLRERNIGAATLYETSRLHWDKVLGEHAPAFSAAMDALEFDTAERLLACAQAPAEAIQRT
jgi:HPt (histidine-containing phosphotransfer) domain-containing protein